MNYKRLILIVLILSVLSFVGYVVYKKYMAKNKEEEEEEINVSEPITDYRDPTEEATISEDLVVDSSAGHQGISLA